MSGSEENMTVRIIQNPNNSDLTNSCRICKYQANGEDGMKMHELFKGRRLIRIIANTIHIEIKDLPGLPRFLCDKCHNLLKTFSAFQVDFRRSEEQFKVNLEEQRNRQTDVLREFAAVLETEQKLETDQNNCALVTSLLKKSKKTKKSKGKCKN